VANGDERESEGGRVTRTTMSVRPSSVEGGEGSQTPGLEAAATAARKRKAEDSVNDKLTAMATTIGRLMATQTEMAESQKAFLESNRMIMDRNKELTEMVKTQGEEIKALRALIQDSTSQRTCSEVTGSGGTSIGAQTSQTRSTSAGSSQVRKEKPQVQDERAVSIDMGRFKGAKNNYNGIRDSASEIACVTDSKSTGSQKR